MSIVTQTKGGEGKIGVFFGFYAIDLITGFAARGLYNTNSDKTPVVNTASDRAIND